MLPKVRYQFRGAYLHRTADIVARSGMTWKSMDQNSYYCFSSFYEPITALLVPYFSDFDTRTSTSFTTLSQGDVVMTPGEVYWGSQDLSLFPREYASSLAQKIGIPFGSTTAIPATSSTLARETNPPTSNPTPTNPPSPPRPGALNTGQKAGITIGTILFATLIVTIIYILLRSRKKQSTSPYTNNQISELEDQESQKLRTWFLGGRWRNEVATVEPEHELDVKGEDQELDSRPLGTRHELDSRDVRVLPGSPRELDGREVGRRSGCGSLDGEVCRAGIGGGWDMII